MYTLFSIWVFIFIFLCEYLIYYTVIYQCSWPKLDEKLEDVNIERRNSSAQTRAMFIADTHLLGPYRGHWFDKLRREWQMYRAFQTSIMIYKPQVVFILGDLFDEGQWCNRKQFNEYLDRMFSLFETPTDTKIYVVPGNHDLGFHYKLRYDLYYKFNSVFNTSSVQFVNLKGNYFVLINSMAMHGDGCNLCSEAQYELNEIAKKLNCLKSRKSCNNLTKLKKYSRPIVLQHFPMYRESDAICNEGDAAPPDIKQIPFKEKWDCLSKKSSEMIMELLNPRLILTGHTHHGCRVLHGNDILEYTLSSFNWRNKNNPTFMLGIMTYNNYALSKCDIPQETTIIYLYSIMLLLPVTSLLIKMKIFR